MKLSEQYHSIQGIGVDNIGRPATEKDITDEVAQLEAENEAQRNALIDYIERDKWGGKLKKETQWLVASIEDDALLTGEDDE